MNLKTYWKSSYK